MKHPKKQNLLRIVPVKRGKGMLFNQSETQAFLLRNEINELSLSLKLSLVNRYKLKKPTKFVQFITDLF